MNKIIIDFPEKLQQNAFAMWMEKEGLDLFKTYYFNKMPNERQPEDLEVEFNIDATGKHFITIE